MAVNFCREYLGTRIVCNQVSTESYEISNLISNNVTARNKGFLAGSFVRPPIDIVIQFPCPVKICCVSVNGRVGSQQSTGCEVLIQKEETSGYDVFNSGVYLHAGKYYWDCDKRGVIAVSAPHSLACKSSHTGDYLMQEINGRMVSAMSHVWSLRLRIIKTAGSSIPAVGGLNVWGYISYSSAAPIARSVLTKWHSINWSNQSYSVATPPSDPNDELAAAPNSVPTCPSPTPTGGNDDFELPEEFLDGLTCEIMALPVRLPSANVIDERTLERFVNQEAAWGRPPSDPFTGQAFSTSHRPVYDTSLKARIDSFLLKESHRACLKNVARTTGPIQTRSVDTLLQLSAQSTTAIKRPGVVAASIVPPVVPQPSVIDPSRRWLSNVASSIQHLTGNHSGRSKIHPAGSSHSSSAAVQTQDAPSRVCPCGSRDGRLLYSLPCTHRICRPCLLKLKSENDLRCSQCSSAFALHQPVLQHSTSTK